MRECFVNKREIKGEVLDIVTLCNEILEEYTDLDIVLSLRGLYYQLVARGHIPNTLRSYKRVGTIVSDARLAGLIDWDHVVDRARETVEIPHWGHPSEIMRAAAEQFRIDKWDDQPVHVEVMAEKDAVSGTLEPICRTLDIPFTANRGYSSQSFMYRRGKILRDKLIAGKSVVVLYLGDHDPSGLDMDRDVYDRLSLFAGASSGALDVVRIALTREQIEHYNPPPNPAKLTDSRAASYVRVHGDESWELDALDPMVLTDLVDVAVRAVRDDDLWAAAVERENEMREQLATAVETLATDRGE